MNHIVTALTGEVISEILMHGTVEIFAESSIQAATAGKEVAHDVLHHIHGTIGYVCQALVVAMVAISAILKIIVAYKSNKLTWEYFWDIVTIGPLTAIAALLVESGVHWFLETLSQGTLMVLIPILAAASGGFLVGKVFWAVTYVLAYAANKKQSTIQLWAARACVIGACLGIVGFAVMAILNPMVGLTAVCVGASIATIAILSTLTSEKHTHTD
jgi:hypothetical protein